MCHGSFKKCDWILYLTSDCRLDMIMSLIVNTVHTYPTTELDDSKSLFFVVVFCDATDSDLVI